LVGRQLDLELGRCSVSAAAYKVGVRFGPGIKTGRQNEASSKFDGSRCFQHDNRSLHLLHSTLSYRLETSTRRQCVACNALKADKRGEEIAKCLNQQSELIASVSPIKRASTLKRMCRRKRNCRLFGLGALGDAVFLSQGTNMNATLPCSGKKRYDDGRRCENIQRGRRHGNAHGLR